MALGRKWRRQLGLVGLLLGAAASPALAQVSTQVGGENGAQMSISSFLQTDWAFSTATKGNPYNEHSLSTDGNTWNQMGYRWESIMQLEATRNLANNLGLDNLRMTVHPRAWLDLGPQVDSDLPDVYLSGGRGGNRYPGNGWAVETLGTKEWILDLMEAYVDARKGPVRLRLGKQQIAWGTALFLRSLDAVNSLDLRRHAIFDIIGNEYADERKGIFTANATVDLPSPGPGLSDVSFNAFISPDYLPWILPAAGSAYNVVSSEVILDEAEQISAARARLVYGGVLKGNLFDVDLTLNFLSTPNTLGVFQLIPATGPNSLESAGLVTPFLIDPARGVNSLQNFVDVANTMRLSVPGIAQTITTAPFNVPVELVSDPVALDQFLRTTPVDVVSTRKFPRENYIGGSASYYIQPVYQFPGSAVVNGTLVKFEGAYTPTKYFTNPSLSAPITSGELNFAIEMEKQVRWLQSLPSAFVVLEYWFKSRGDFVNRWLPFEGQNKFQVVGLAMQQGVMGNRVRLDSSLVIDVAGPGTWFQPGVLYKPRDYLELGVYYNYLQGTSHDIFGALKTFDEVFTKVTVKF
jgi:hypothetical protein